MPRYYVSYILISKSFFWGLGSSKRHGTLGLSSRSSSPMGLHHLPWHLLAEKNCVLSAKYLQSSVHPFKAGPRLLIAFAIHITAVQRIKRKYWPAFAKENGQKFMDLAVSGDIQPRTLSILG